MIILKENNVDIKIVRLQNGEDIIGHVSKKPEGSYDITEPMTVNVEFHGKTSGLVMRHWLPVQLVKTNEITIEHKDILCVIDPADEFAEYYANTVEKIRELLKAKNLVDELDDDEYDDVMEAFEELKHSGDTLH